MQHTRFVGYASLPWEGGVHNVVMTVETQPWECCRQAVPLTSIPNMKVLTELSLIPCLVDDQIRRRLVAKKSQTYSLKGLSRFLCVAAARVHSRNESGEFDCIPRPLRLAERTVGVALDDSANRVVVRKKHASQCQRVAPQTRPDTCQPRQNGIPSLHPISFQPTNPTAA